MTQILLTNDDGINSPGLAVLRRALEPLGEVLTVAPLHNMSGVARGITIGRPLRVSAVEVEGCAGLAVDGTPVDCVRVGLLGVLGPAPDVIVSGVNLGGNMGNDVTYSGTVGAALEAALHGLPAVAVSIETREPHHLEAETPLLTALVDRVLLAPLPDGVVLNVNLPDLPPAQMGGVRVTKLGGASIYDRLVLHDDDGLRGEHQVTCEPMGAEWWPADDFTAVREGFVSLTPLRFDLTSDDGLRALAAWPLADVLVADRSG